MKLLDLLAWAVSLSLITVAGGVLTVCLALAVGLWPERRGGRTRHPSGLTQRDRIVRHLRRLFGSRKHPRHPAPANDDPSSATRP